MGCDIHVYVEAKHNDKWEHLTRVEDAGRSYSMFAMMANIYNDGGIEPISEPRGLPADVTTETAKHYSSEEYFGASWLSDGEIALLRDRYAEYMKKEYGDVESDITRDYFGIVYPNSQELRLVFWFDN